MEQITGLPLATANKSF